MKGWIRKVYRVRFSCVLLCHGETEADAIKAAEEAVRSGDASAEMSGGSAEVEQEITSLGQVAAEEREILPWGDGDDLTVRQLVEGPSVGERPGGGR